MKEFIRKYLTRSILILIIFLVMNAILLGVSVTLIFHHTKDTEDDIHYVAEKMMVTEEGKPDFSDQAKSFMEENHIWSMVISNQGDVIASYQLPDELDKTYTISEVAEFSRWYLDGYPVLVQVMDAGLLVIGYASNDMLGVTITKLYYVTDSGFITAILITVIVLFTGNVVALICLFWKNSKSVEHEVEKEFRKKDEARAQWINGVTHDIRTPLSVIMGYAAQIEEAPDLEESRKKQAKIMRKQGERVRDLIIDLNLVSKLEYAMQPLKMARCNPAELICETIIEFMENGEGSYEIEPDIPEYFATEFYGDQALLKRMLVNLINNSVLHNEEKVKITVSLGQLEKGFFIEVTDDGTGMKPEKILELNAMSQPKDYEIYKENGDSAHGVGLRLVMDTVIAHKGTIEFDNVSPHGLKVRMVFFLLNVGKN